jgi:hypothetical protein
MVLSCSAPAAPVTKVRKVLLLFSIVVLSKRNYCQVTRSGNKARTRGIGIKFHRNTAARCRLAPPGNEDPPKGSAGPPEKEATTEAAAEFREETSKMQQSSKTGLLRWTQSAIRLRLATQLCAAPYVVVQL